MAKQKMNGFKLNEEERKVVLKALEVVQNAVPDERDMNAFEVKATLLAYKMRGGK